MGATSRMRSIRAGTTFPDRRIARAFDIAALDHVPQRDAVPKQQHPLGRKVMIARHLFTQAGGDHAPKTIARVAVVELIRARKGRRKRSEHERTAVPIEHRIERLNDMLVLCHLNPSFQPEPAMAECASRPHPHPQLMRASARCARIRPPTLESSASARMGVYRVA